MSSKNVYVFCIDTNSYAGNFEREMCAYATGVVGWTDDTGSEQADEFRNSHSEEVVELFSETIRQEMDDNGTERPCAIDWNNNNNVHIFFNEKPSVLMIDIMKRRADIFAKDRPHCFNKDVIEIKGFKLIERVTEEKETEIAI